MHIWDFPSLAGGITRAKTLNHRSERLKSVPVWSGIETSSCHATNDRFGSVPFSRARTTASAKECCSAARHIVTRSCRRRERRCTGIKQLRPATQTLVSEISLHRSRTAAFPSAPQLSGPPAFMLHLRGLRLSHFRKELEAVDRCDADERLLLPRAAVELGNVDRRQRGRSRQSALAPRESTEVALRFFGQDRPAPPAWDGAGLLSRNAWLSSTRIDWLWSRPKTHGMDHSVTPSL
jgi:hypothetical protein